VSNAREFRNFRATFRSRDAAPAAAVPVSITTIRQLRFKSRADRPKGTLYEILTGSLASLRRLQEPSAAMLDALWSVSPRPS
jgi:hypothetical protein